MDTSRPKESPAENLIRLDHSGIEAHAGSTQASKISADDPSGHARTKKLLEEWEQPHAELALSDHPLARTSSRTIRRAYEELLRLYPGEEARNKQAFYDYLSALDLTPSQPVKRRP
ncbi:MAG: hypothetical protein NC910_00430 [Candidatus Omnitrophica bacterium]|nr:hypothetical protein [Candidatus Omnitrophota bacterium]